ncbi:coiled-coil domain-containing protein 86-like [Ambystoma mexicanum]|uniref:coiled-coil domain-containing protein 86-like n=1 Tax=Ambystoma mexicanum TaxID=8296 RepID=UPI0037E92DB2
MAEAAETPIRRSRRLVRGGPVEISEEADVYGHHLKATHNKLEEETRQLKWRQLRDNDMEGSLKTIEDEILQNGDGVGDAPIVQLAVTASLDRKEVEKSGSENKSKQQEAPKDLCKRPLLRVKETQANPYSNEQVVVVIPKGKPKSGRIWKDPNIKRFSGMVKDRPLHSSWAKKVKARQEMRIVKDFAKHLRDEKARAKEEKKQRRAENLKRRLENERKGEVVQVITNLAKLKRAKKKQLRRIEKRDTLTLLQGRHGAQKNMGKVKSMGKMKPKTEAEQNTN